MARENIRRYEWARSVRDSWERQVAPIMAQDRDFIEAMIPELTGWTTYGNNCPECVGKQSSMGECGLYRWDVKDPDKLVCKYCGTVYPNEKYPETGRLECPSMGQTFTFYQTDGERAHPTESGKHALRWASWPVNASWTGYIRTMKATWCVRMLEPLAKLYAVTGDVKYAERAVWVLDRLARVYPNWLYHTYNGMVADCPPAEAATELGRNPPAGRFPKAVVRSAHNLYQYEDHARLCVGFWGAGRLGTGSAEGSYLLNATVAYDLIREARGPDGQPVMPPDVEKRVVDDLILAGCADRENWAAINNKAGPNRALSAAVGILFQRPASVRRALDGFEQLMAQCFHFDGFCRESPSYSCMHLSLMADIPVILRGYSDPPGYQPPDGGQRFEHLDPYQRVTRYRLALLSMVRMLAPGQKYPVLGDTHYGAGISRGYAEILTYRYGAQYVPLLETVAGQPLQKIGGEYALWYRDPNLARGETEDLPLHTEWFPGWRVAVLRAGQPQGDTALYLNAYAYHGHRHHDTLGLVYYAYGRELASDRGYIWDDPRNAWTKSTQAHNIVTVDDQNQEQKERTSVLELFGTGPGVEVVQARARSAYKQCSLYARTCALIRVDARQTYAIDVFRVRGGKRHQYGFQCNGTMAEFAGGELIPVDEPHKWLTLFRACAPAGPVTATWQHDGVLMDLLMLSRPDRAVIADAPGWRSDKGAELNAPPIQQFFAERTSQGEAELDSTFVAIACPRITASPIRTAEHFEGPDGAVAVRVELADRIDWTVSAPQGKPLRIGPVQTDAKFAFVSVTPSGEVLTAWMLGGTELHCNGASVTLPSASLVFDVERVEGSNVYAKSAMDQSHCLVGGYLLTEDTGFEIQAVEGNCITVRDTPMIPCTTATILHSVSLQRQPRPGQESR